ncbi:uncharacterized protein LOC129760510 [Uranotaenia lowii]|uniref:uncharacterized protein LOC129760510 n=1 Tax=Uranotaenia lowii TaxID=190385 RepID=UPI002478C2DD|nr:uncharacterized protein LOC129760510 [Uranotaenia lowii]
MEASFEVLFWLQIEKLVGPVPENLKLLLQFSCFCNISIADLDDELINQIEQEARTIPAVLRIASNERLMKKYFGVYFLFPNEFRFRSGERMLMKNIAMAVRKKGLDSFIQSLRPIPQESRPVMISMPVQNTDPQTLRQILKDKILNALNNSQPEIIPEYLKIIQEHLDVQIVTEQGIPDAFVICPLCNAKSKLSKDRPGHIIVSNYTLHVRKYHSYGPVSQGQGAKRKIEEFGSGAEFMPEHMMDSIVKEEPDTSVYEHNSGGAPFYQIDLG